MTEYAEPLFSRPLLPIVNTDDAGFTCAATFPRIVTAGGRAFVVHTVEKVGDAPDKTSVEQHEEVVDELLDTVCRVADDAGTDLYTGFRFATDVGDVILEATAEADATAIVFILRGGRL